MRLRRHQLTFKVLKGKKLCLIHFEQKDNRPLTQTKRMYNHDGLIWRSRLQVEAWIVALSIPQILICKKTQWLSKNITTISNRVENTVFKFDSQKAIVT